MLSLSQLASSFQTSNILSENLGQNIHWCNPTRQPFFTLLILLQTLLSVFRLETWSHCRGKRIYLFWSNGGIGRPSIVQLLQLQKPCFSS